MDLSVSQVDSVEEVAKEMAFLEKNLDADLPRFVVHHNLKYIFQLLV